MTYKVVREVPLRMEVGAVAARGWGSEPRGCVGRNLSCRGDSGPGPCEGALLRDYRGRPVAGVAGVGVMETERGWAPWCGACGAWQAPWPLL